MAYINKRYQLEVGQIYTIELTIPNRKDPTHWYNSYYIPVEEKDDHKELYMINRGAEPKFGTTNTIKNKLYANITDRPGTKHRVIRYIFE